MRHSSLLVNSLVNFILISSSLVLSENISTEELENHRSLHNVWRHYDLGVARIGKFSAPNEEVEPNEDSPLTSLNSTAREETKARGDNGTLQCNFGGKSLRVAVSLQPPLVDCHQNLYGDWLCNGSNIEVIRVLETRFNFRAEWLVLADTIGNYAAADDNNDLQDVSLPDPVRFQTNASKMEPHLDEAANYTGGVLGLLSSGRAWFSANGIIATRTRTQNGSRNSKSSVQLSEPFDSFKLHFLLSKSVRDHDHIFVKPFSFNAWLAILSSALIIVPIIYLVNTTSYHYKLQADSSLNQQISSLACLRLIAGRVFRRPRLPPLSIGCAASSNRSSFSSSTTAATLDQEVDKMLFGEDNFMPTFQVIPQLPPPQVKQRDQTIRERKLRLRQWAFDRRKARRLGRRSNHSGFFKMAYIVWYIVSSLANQGGETEDLPHASSTRVLVAFWWLYLIVICSIHSGILTAILTFPKQNDFIQTLDDFLALDQSERQSFKLSVDRRSELAHLLSSADNLHKSPLQLLWPQMDPLASGRHSEEASSASHRVGSFNQPRSPFVQVDFQRHRQRLLDEIQRGHCAFIEEKSTINLIITQEYFDQRPHRCLLKSSRYPIDIIPMSLAFSTKLLSLDCIRSFDSILRHIMKTGLAQKWRRRYEPNGNDCLNTVIINAGDVDKIQLRQVMLAFWLLLLGLLLGGLVLVFEVIWLFTADDDDGDDDEDGSENFDDTNSSNSAFTSFKVSLNLSAGNSDEEEESTSDEDEGFRFKLGHRLSKMAQRRRIKSLRTNFASRLRQRSSVQASESPIDWPASSRQLSPELQVSGELVIAASDLRAASQMDLGGKLASSGSTLKQQPSRSASMGANNASNAASKVSKRRQRAAAKRARRIKRTVDLVRKLHEGKVYAGVFSKVSDGIQTRARRASHAIVDRFGGGANKVALGDRLTIPTIGSNNNNNNIITVHLNANSQLEQTAATNENHNELRHRDSKRRQPVISSKVMPANQATTK